MTIRELREKLDRIPAERQGWDVGFIISDDGLAAPYGIEFLIYQDIQADPVNNMVDIYFHLEDDPLDLDVVGDLPL